MSLHNLLKNTQVITLVYLLVYSLIGGGKASAQLTPDGTLGAENSVVVPLDPLVEQIQGGAIRGGNLFHSFTEFNISLGKSVYFANPVAIINILTRVTGSNSSHILGTLGVDGNANLILINPNGINFGSDARLDLRGSFTATTADGVMLGENAFFSATDIGNSSLLSIQPGAFFKDAWQAYQSEINQEGDLAVKPGESLTLLAEEVNVTGSLTASGGEVAVLGDAIVLEEDASIDVSEANGGGTVLIGGDFQGQGETPTASQTFVGGNTTVNADATVDGNGGRVIFWANEITEFYGNVSARGACKGSCDPSNSDNSGGFVEVSGKEELLFRGQVDTTSDTGITGTLLLDPRNITIRNGSGTGSNVGVNQTIYERELETQAQSNNIILQADNNIRLRNLSDNTLNLSGGPGSIVFTADADRDGMGNFIMQDTGDTILAEGRDVEISGVNLTIGSIDTSSFSFFGNASNGGTINLKGSGSITVDGNLDSSSLSFFGNAGNGGAIKLDAGGDITLNSGFGTISVGSLGGKISLESEGDIQAFDGLISNSSLGQVSNTQGGDISVTAQSLLLRETTLQTQTVGQANTGKISINTTNLNLTDGSQIAAFTLGQGNVGLVEIHSTDSLSLTGENSQQVGSRILSQVLATGKGNSAGVAINTGSLQISNGGQIATSILGEGNAGLVKINATDSIILAGENSQGFGNSIFSQVITGAKGDSDGVEINTGSLQVQDGSQIAASTFGEGNAGLVKINATDSVFLAGESSGGFGTGIFSQVITGAKGDSGGVELNTSSLHLADGSQITASTFGEGDAGLVKINSTDSVLLTGENSQGSRSGIFSQVEATGKGNSGGVELNTNSLELRDGTQVIASTFGEGDAGLVKISAADYVLLAKKSSQGFGSGIFSRVFAAATGNSGGVQITANSLEIQDGGQVNVSTDGKGDAGLVDINTTDYVRLAGEDSFGFGSGIFSRVLANATGNSGGVQITANSLEIQDGGQVNVSTDGKGDAGLVDINTTDYVRLAGEDSFGFGSGIFSRVLVNATGNSEGVQITSNSLQLQDGSQISASTAGNGDAGLVRIRAADSVSLTGESTQSFGSGILSQVLATGKGNSRNIELDTTSLEVRDGGFISASTAGEGDAGLIKIRATDSIVLAGEDSQGSTSVIFSQVSTTGNGNSGSIELDTSSLEVRDGGLITASTAGNGDAGLVRINATNSVILVGEDSQGFGGGISSQVLSTGKGDSEGIEIATGSLQINDGGQVTASTFGEGDTGLIKINATNSVILAEEDGEGFPSAIFSQVSTGGKGNSEGIEINTGSLQLNDGGRLGASTFGEGDAGLIQITARESVLIAGQSSQGFVSAILSAVEATGKGNSGGVDLATGSLQIQGGQVSTSTIGAGNAEKIDITVNDDISLGNKATIATATSGNGREAGDITLRANGLSATDGSQLTSSTDNSFDAGDINLFVTEDITLAGENTGLFANTSPNSSGNSGNIFIDPITMAVRDGAQIAVNSQGSGLGGNITIFAGDLNLSNQGVITAATVNTSGGNITLNVPGLILMRNNSLISAAAGGLGNGGNINLNVGFIVAVPIENSDVVARASQGLGGNIIIDADGVYGFVGDSRFLTPFSDLNASSDVVGNEGNVAINVQFDATQGLNELPASLVDAESLVDKNACKIENDRIAGGSYFSVTGRGGLPTNPLVSLEDSNILIEWAIVDELAGNTNATITEQPEITYEQAQGWEFTPEGEVILTAIAREITPNPGGLQHPACRNVTPKVK